MADDTTQGQNLDGWDVCDKLSIVQAVLLSLGLNPSQYQNAVEEKPSPKNPNGYDPLFQAVTHGILSKELTATVVSKDIGRRYLVGMMPPVAEIISEAEVDWNASTVAVSDMRTWLVQKNKMPPFFFPEGEHLNPLNKHGKYYAPKLAAAIQAWHTVASDENLIKLHGNPKQAIEKWLNEHGEQYGMIKNGKIVNLGFDQICGVANWDPAGGKIKLSEKAEKAPKKGVKK